MLNDLLFQSGGFLYRININSNLHLGGTFRHKRAALRCGDARQLARRIVADLKAYLFQTAHLDVVCLIRGWGKEEGKPQVSLPL